MIRQQFRIGGDELQGDATEDVKPNPENRNVTSRPKEHSWVKGSSTTPKQPLPSGNLT